jgi:hypothetical protein
MSWKHASRSFPFWGLCLALLGFEGSVLFATPPAHGGLSPMFAQTDAAAADDSPGGVSQIEPTSTPAEIPHGKFLLDYLLVAALLAGAIYAVCRSSRRV